MKYEKWLKHNTKSLVGKTVAITGSTGGLGKELCRYIASLGADLVLLDRNQKRSEEHKREIESMHGVKVSLINIDLEDIDSVRSATDMILSLPIDIFIHNAGAYSIPRRITSCGYDNIFTINFVSPYYIIKRLLPSLSERNGRIVVVGSIAHNYSRIDVNDIDFHTRRKASLVYGNAKRYLMFSLYELSKKENASLSVVHPGITFTNITAHYPKFIFAIIKHPMKIIFMKPRKAALSLLRGLFEECGYKEWIGPKIFNIWGMPRCQALGTCSDKESNKIYEISEEIYRKL